MSVTMVWYVMLTFCHWYKDAGNRSLLNYIEMTNS